jgi:hypothetical protein
MSNNRQRDYISKHIIIRNKLIEIVNSTGTGCVDVSQLSYRLGMDVRTVSSHLEVMEVDSAGVFVDPSKKQFCTKEGISLLANALKLREGDSN